MCLLLLDDSEVASCNTWKLNESNVLILIMFYYFDDHDDDNGRDDTMDVRVL